MTNEEMKKELESIRLVVAELTENLDYIVRVHDEEIFGVNRWDMFVRAAKKGNITKSKIVSMKAKL